MSLSWLLWKTLNYKMSQEHVDNDLPSLAEEPSDLQNTASFNSFFSEDSRTSDSFNGFDHQDADHIKRVATKDMINHMIELDSVQKRLDTFSRWPRDNPVEPLELAKAGFYSTGVDDRVVCFKCDLHLRQWKTGDNPWKEHKLFSPQCPFLKECENERGSHFLCNGVDKSKNLQNSSSLDSSKIEEVVFSEGRLGNHRRDDAPGVDLPPPYCDPEGVVYSERQQGFHQGKSERPFYRNPDYSQTGLRDQLSNHAERISPFPAQDFQHVRFQRSDNQRIEREVVDRPIALYQGSRQVHIIGSGTSVYYFNPEDNFCEESGGQVPPQEMRSGGNLTPFRSQALRNNRFPVMTEQSFAGPREVRPYRSQDPASGRYETYLFGGKEQVVEKPLSSQEESGRYVVHQQQNGYPGKDKEYGRYFEPQHPNAFKEPNIQKQIQFSENVPRENTPSESNTMKRKVSDQNGALQENYQRTQQYPGLRTWESSSAPQPNSSVNSPGQGSQTRRPAPFAAFPVKDPSLQPVQRLVRHEDARHVTSSSDLASQHHRLTTFVDWPHDHAIHPYDLAAAGFYYLGQNDSVRCFKCSISLHNWDPDDTPWGEHMKWSPQCPLVLQRFGSRQRQQKEQLAPRPNAIPQERYPSPQNTPQFQRQEQNRFPIVSGHRLVHPGWSRQQNPPAQAVSNVGRPQDPLVGKQPHQWQTQSIATPQESAHMTNGRPEDSTSESSANQRKQRSCSPRGSTTMELKNERLSEMGFTKQQIDDAIRAQVAATGSNFASHADLVSALLDTQGQQQRNPVNHQQQQPMEPGCRSASPPPPIRIPPNFPISLLEENHNFTGRNCSSAVTSPTTSLVDVASLRRSFSDPAAQRFSDSGEESLEEKLERMQEERMCKICMDAEVSVVFLPCGHLSCCVGCANGMNSCPMCRRAIHDKRRIYLS